MKGKTGVYRIRNIRNRKVYIGSAARCFWYRYKKHINELKSGTHHSRHLQNSWDLYGPNCFKFEVVEECEPEKCIEREQIYIDRYKAYDRRYGYNDCPKAGSCLGLKSSPEARRNIGNAKRGIPLTDAHKRNIKNALTGRTLSTLHKKNLKAALSRPEVRQSISKARKGYIHTEEAKVNMSKAQKGRKNSPEHQAKLIAAITGRSLSPAHKRKISEGNRGKTISLEQRRKLSEAQTGKTYSKESKMKMSKSAKLAWKRRKRRIKK